MTAGRVRAWVAGRPVASAAAATAFVLAAVTAWGAYHDTGASICPSRTVFGFTCPGCGLTRATLSLLRGDWSASWGYHPLAAVMLLQAVVVVAVAVGVRRGRWKITPRAVNLWMIANIVVLLGVWLVRIPLGALPPN